MLILWSFGQDVFWSSGWRSWSQKLLNTFHLRNILLCSQDSTRPMSIPFLWMRVNKINWCDKIFSCIAWLIQMRSKKNTLWLMSWDAKGVQAIMSARCQCSEGQGLCKLPDFRLRLLPLQELNCGYKGKRQLTLGVRQQFASSLKSCLWRQLCIVQET